MASPKPSATIRVPLINSPTCGDRSPKSHLPCSRAAGHAGRHAFVRRFIEPGRVREVWS